MTELEVADCFQEQSEKQLTHEEIGFIYVCDSSMDVFSTGFKEKVDTFVPQVEVMKLYNFRTIFNNSLFLLY